jgi:UDP-N-acetylmuramoylalanine--D-glutamate ligase
VLISELQGRDIAILGLGEEGLSAHRYLRRHLPQQAITVYNEQALPEAVTRLLDPALDRLVTGPFTAAALGRHQVLLRSPGVSPYRPELSAAAANGVCFTSASNLWFAANPHSNAVCITGTKGKSTTTALVRHLLNAAGLRAEVAGNIGRPLLDCPPGDADWWVVELSSYQLHDLAARPRLAALLNLSDEHLDWHHGAGNYRRDKLRLAAMVDPQQLVVNWADLELRKLFADSPGVLWSGHEQGIHHRDGALFDAQQLLLEQAPAALPGRHNLENLATALTIARQVAPLPPDPGQVLAGFAGLPHRLKPVLEQHGLQFIDDSLSTTPVATLAALEALQGRPVTLLLGGLDRGLDWQPLCDRFKAAAPYAVIGMPASGAKLVRQLGDAGLHAEGGLHTSASLDEAVVLARRITPAGGVVLLSPGAPSFPHFQNYRARGAAFLAAATAA